MSGTPAPIGDQPPIDRTETPPPTPPEPTPPVQAKPPAAPPATIVIIDDDDRTEGVAADGDRVAVPQASFRKLKDKAQQRGRDQAQAELAKKLGFESVEAMLTAIDRKEITMSTPAAPGSTTPPASGTPGAPAVTPPAVVATPPATPPPATPPGEDPSAPENDRRYSAEQRRKLRQAREDMQAKVAAKDAELAAAKTLAESHAQQLEVFKAEQGMRDELIRTGCADIDYTFHQLRAHLAELAKDKSPEGDKKLKEFNIKTWADEIRKARPYLFGAVNQPANTGNPPTPPATPPGPGDAAAAAAGGAKKDARNMTKAEWDAYRKQHGIPA